MRIRRTAFGMAVATVLLLGLGSCGDENKTPQAADTPSVTTPTRTPTPTPTPVDPTTAVKAKIIADYKLSIETQSNGIVSNNPTYPYEQVLTGKALSALRSVVTGAQMIGTKYSGGVRFIKAKVTALNLTSKPATATVQACVFDGLKATSKSGKVTTSSTQLSREDHLVLIAGRWKATETKSLNKSAPGCA